jgi:hypothetical protein
MADFYGLGTIGNMDLGGVSSLKVLRESLIIVLMIA